MKPGLERTVVWGSWLLAALQPLVLLVDRIPDDSCKRCPRNILMVSDSPTATDVLMTLLGVPGVAMLAGLGIVLILRWRSAGPVQQRALAPVLWTGAAVAAVGVASAIPSVLDARA